MVDPKKELADIARILSQKPDTAAVLVSTPETIATVQYEECSKSTSCALPREEMDRAGVPLGRQETRLDSRKRDDETALPNIAKDADYASLLGPKAESDSSERGECGMPTNPEHYQPVESYVEAHHALHGVAGLILFELAREKRDTRDTIIRNFIARTDMMVRGVFRLWNLEDYQDCWILHRCLLDRLFHLADLDSQNQFETFEAWSFLKQYKANTRIRSDPEFGGALRESGVIDPTPEQRTRGEALSRNPPVWTRPKAEDVSRKLCMRFLYSFGYDYGSMHVHPMADDGEQDFFTITGLGPRPLFADQRTVLSNTLLVGTMVLQQALNASSPSWRALIYDFLSDLRRFLGDGSDDYKMSFVKLGRLAEQGARLSDTPMR